MKKRCKSNLMLVFTAILAALFHLARGGESQEDIPNDKAFQYVLDDVETWNDLRGSLVERNSLRAKNLLDNDVLRGLKNGSPKLKEKEGLESSLMDYGKLSAPEDVNGGLIAARVDAVLSNLTALERTRGLLEHEDFFPDLSTHHPFEFPGFGQEDVFHPRSRVRRVSEPYRYRRFQQPLRAYVPENSPVGTFVLEIPRNYEGKLEIVHPENPICRLNSQTAVVGTIQRLDYEKQKVYKLIIRDSENDGDNSPFYNHVVIIYVVDINDNAPTLNMRSFSGRVNSRSRVGSQVAQLNATDSDGGKRGHIGFTIEDQNSPFTVNPKTRVLETNGKPLDASQFQYPVNVKAFDQGYPRQESPSAVIAVNKVNDAPRFFKTMYTITFSEKTLPGVIIGQVMAKSLSNIPVGYEIVPRSDDYEINPHGELSLKRSINYETAGSSKSSVITVRASELTEDNPLSSQVSVTLVVTNDNENPTTFTEAVYNVQIDEDASPGSFVSTVSVTDCDCAGDCRCNGTEMRFSLQNANGYFVINETGGIRTVKTFDYETQNTFQFMVIAQDHVGFSGDEIPARAYVSVKLRDVNNNAPKFIKAYYHFDIDEDSYVGHLVGVVQATDKDLTSSPLTYRISTSVPKEGVFAIEDQRFGILTVASSLKRETQSTFTLTVEASDGLQSSETTVDIHVADVNDNAPRFTTCPESVNVGENLSPGARVIVLKAEDNDRGKNALVEYFIERSHDLISSDDLDVFVVNNDTGEVQTALVLDREVKSHYLVIASARDRGHNSELRQVGYCQFVVNVQDENDNYPSFEVSRYETSVSQDLRVGSSVLKLQATDADIGVNSEVTYTVHSGNELFQVASDGWVTVKSSLRGKQGTKLFTVTAGNSREYRGQGISDETHNTTVEILITDQILPVFDQLVFRGDVKENTHSGEAILNISAVPSSSRSGMVYFFAELRRTIQFPFSIDHGTGSIQLTSGLDFEQQQKFVFSVNAHETGRRELVEASVEITVVDINDVAPIFGRARYDATVSEGALPGTVVIHIKATDPDPPNVAITYEIQDVEDSNLFTLRNYSTSVEVLTKEMFNREERELYNIILVASDNGDPRIQSTTFVTVRVLDENDSPPVFDSARYMVSVPENTPVGQTVETVVTRDRDLGENAKALFFITAGNDGRFQVTSEHAIDSNRGYLVIESPLDYESNSEYNLTVVASDKKFSAATTVTVEVTNADDDPPHFEKSLYNTSLSENTPSGTSFLVVEATDNDSPDGRLVYSVDSAAAPYFIIGSATGILTTTTTPLDREKTPVVVFAVIVTDGTNKARTFVEVTVLDVNDPPYFPNSPYIAYVKENQPQGTYVRYVTAFDGDDPNANDGRNSDLTYTIDTTTGKLTYDEDGEMFSIDSVTGLIVTDTVFDLERIRRNLTIQVRATDGGTPSLSATAVVTVVIEDVSEFPPKFTARIYREQVAEDAPLGHLVLKLKGMDEDFTLVGHQYSITNGNYPFGFYVQPDTGKIVVAGMLDYESKQDYNLTVSVSERNISKTFDSDYASVLISILDSNDQPPVFNPKTYYRKISEDVVLGTEVQVVTCSDGDEGPNAVPTFSLTSGNTDDAFEVKSHPDNKNLGVVRVAGALDREKTVSYTLTITATDIGGLTDTATLVVELEDVNDTPPTFIPSYYEGSIREGVREEQRVVRISVTDPDLPPGGGPFTFTLKNFDNKFQLKNPGSQSVELFTNFIEFNRETTPLYEVLVEATDGGSPARSAEAMIFVDVIDGKVTQEPFDGSMTIIVYALDGRFQGGTVGHVYYRDDDYLVDTSEYALISQQPGSYFTVDSTTGRIRSSANIPDGTYSVSVTVREKSRSSGENIGKTVSSEISVLVRSVNSTALQHAVVLRFPLRRPGQFVNSLYMKLVEMLGEIFGVPSENVYAFSIRKSSESVADSPYGIDVWIVIRGTENAYMNPNYVFAILEMDYDKLATIGSEKLEIGLDKCAAESKSVGVCKNLLTAKKSFTVVSGYYGQVPAPSSSLTIVGIDTELRDMYKVLPEPAPNCQSRPCRNGGTCHDVVPQGFVCECPPGFRGSECQVTTRNFKKPDSYIWLEPLSAYELSSISFEFMSEPNIGNGLLLYQGALRKDGYSGIVDFLAVSLLNGFVTVAVSLGGRPSSFDLRDGNRLDDGKWHHVEIKRVKKEIRLIVDHCESATTTEEEGRFFEDRKSCEVVSQSFENFIYLNGFGPLQIGGSSTSSFSHPSIATQSFYGCIRNIYDSGQMYDLHDPLKVVNAPAGCDQGCSSSRCQNNGYCEGETYSSSSCCTCSPGFTGCDCSERSPSLWYLTDSFSEYNMTAPEQNTGRRRRQLYPSFPRSSPKFHTDLLVRLRVRPDVNNAMFFRSSTSGRDSLSELGLKDKVLYYTFEFADETKTISLPGGNIADNRWHNVQVKRRGNTASLQLDYKAKSYGTTGGIVRLIDFSDGSLYTGGFPQIVSEEKDLGANGSLGSLSGKRKVVRVDEDFRGCTSGAVYNGKELDETFKFNRFRVVKACPCTAVVDCKNNGTCVDEDPPYCVCQAGFTGATCEELMALPTQDGQGVTIEGFRSSSRHRLLDPVWICVFLLSLITLIILLCLLHTLPIVGSDRPLIEEDAHDSIMVYQEHGNEEADETGYDINVLIKSSRQRVVRGAVLSSTNAAMEREFEGSGKLGINGVDPRGNNDRLGSWIMERVSNVDRDLRFFPQDEMREIRDEGKYSEVDDLSELEPENDDSAEDEVDVFAIDWENFVR